MLRMIRRAFTPLSTCLVAILLSAPGLFAQEKVIPLWPHTLPEPPQTTAAEVDVTKPTDALISGHRTARLTNVTKPTMSVYPPHGNEPNEHGAALVFPGGGYVRLAWDGEGLDTCKWLNSIGLTCLLVKYRVPEQGHYPDNYADLEDAQQAMRIARAHAAEWNIDPTHIGVVGFSAGGNLAALLSTHPDDDHVLSTPAASEVDRKIDAHANFAIVVYPAYLGVEPSFKDLNPIYTPNKFTPPTFLLQAENDRSYGKNALVYYRGLMDAGVPAELHLYASGGHGFGMHPVGTPAEHWTQTATAWLRSIGMVPAAAAMTRADAGSGNGWVGPPSAPCPVPQPQPTSPTAKADTTTIQPQTDPACW
jgi:acetyl esterase/lipase